MSIGYNDESVLITYVDEIHKVGILAVDHLCEVFGTWNTHLALTIWHDNRSIVLIKENFPSRGSGEHGAWWHALDLHHKCHVIFFVFTGEKWLSDVKLIEDAAEGPHVDRTRVTDTKHNFWRAIEPRLDVGVYFLVFEAPGAKVDNFDT